MALIAKSLLLYAVLCSLLFLWLDDPWTKVGSIASILGAALTVLTLALVSFIKRDLIAKNNLRPLQIRLRSLNSALAAALGNFDNDPNSVKESLSQIAGLLISLEGKMSGDYKALVSGTRNSIKRALKSRSLFGSAIVLNQSDARTIYESLLNIEEAIRHLIRDLQRS